MQDSVAAHKIADVEVAGFLSGGVDSSYITSLANNRVPSAAW
ncbi:asparagine synthase-related protein [Gemmiger formicilis]